MAADDTIVALASGPLPSAIALIRVSGPRVRELVVSCLSRSNLEHRKATVTVLQDTDENPIDEVVATLYEGPRSYTGEDVLELGLHGGRAVIARAIETLSAIDGVRLAEPGEFTRRAVLAGKLDLVEAEGVADLVDAETEAQRAQALSQLAGGTSEKVEAWHRQMVEVMSLVEVSVDFPDEDDAPDHTQGPVADRLDHLIGILDEVLEQAKRGIQIRDGFSVVIVGPPNAGKSSLLNRLAQREVAIVTDTPGTTRDIIEVRLNLGGYLVRVSDTAGLRDGADAIEAEGIRRARHVASEADLVVGVYDAARETRVPVELEMVEPDIILANKSDLAPESKNVSRETLPVSALTGEGMDQLIAAVVSSIAIGSKPGADPIISRRRHLDAVSGARQQLLSARSALNMGYGMELVAEDIRMAARCLEGLLGRVDVEDILGSIFSSFCIGK